MIGNRDVYSGRLMRILQTILVVVCAAASSGTVAAQQTQPGALVAAVQRAGDDPDAYRRVVEAAIDAGSGAVTYLEGVLTKGSESERLLGVLALGYVGGDAAIAVLQNEYRSKPSVEVKTYLCYALASRGNHEDRAFLIRSLEGEHIGDDWPPIVSAALSLGVLREAEATDALTRTMNKDPGTSASDAAQTALSWLAQPKAQPPVGLAGPNSGIIAAVLNNGIPRSGESDELVDRQRKGTWVHRNRAWSFRPGTSNRRYPSMTMKVHVSPDSQRALVSIGLVFGLKNGSGYDYVLRRASNGWVVQGVLFTWIS